MLKYQGCIAVGPNDLNVQLSSKEERDRALRAEERAKRAYKNKHKTSDHPLVHLMFSQHTYFDLAASTMHLHLLGERPSWPLS